MDDLKGKTIKQFNYNLDDNICIITCIYNKSIYEFYGHFKDYGVIYHLLGITDLQNKTIKEWADCLFYEYKNYLKDFILD